MLRILRKSQIGEKTKFKSLKVRISFLRTLYSIFVPGGFLVLGTAILLQRGVLTKALPWLVHAYPYIVLIAGGLVAWRFNRSRLALVILILALASISLVLFAGGSAASVGGKLIVYNAVSILLPLNLIVLSLIKERGFKAWQTWQGKWPLGMILFQVLVVVPICLFPKLGLRAHLEYSFIKRPFFGLPLSQPALIAFGAAFLFLTARYIQHRSSIECGFLWTLVSSFSALALHNIGPVTVIYFATAGLVLIISMIETSFYFSFYDDLTDLPARRAMNDTLSRLGRNFSVAMIDIDSFKKLSDRYGHEVGDQILRMVATKLIKITGGGLSYRCSAQKFAVIFPNKFVDETIHHLESLRKSVEIYGFILRGSKRPRKRPEHLEKLRGPQKRIYITISVGVAEREDTHLTHKHVIKAAEKALDRAKDAGSNQIAT